MIDLPYFRKIGRRMLLEKCISKGDYRLQIAWEIERSRKIDEVVVHGRHVAFLVEDVVGAVEYLNIDKPCEKG